MRPKPVPRLGRLCLFPDPARARADGLVARGGDLSVARLVQAYRAGIFPWYETGPVLWHSPDPRMILEPLEFRLPRKLRAALRRDPPAFALTADAAFPEVVRGCASVERPAQPEPGTWIGPEMIDAYVAMHRRGYAHSVEAWRDGRLVGGVYGVEIGRAFFGESMFRLVPDASKAALAALAALGRLRGWHFIDAQLPSPHVARAGGRVVRRRTFLQLLRRAVALPAPDAPWPDRNLERLLLELRPRPE